MALWSSDEFEDKMWHNGGDLKLSKFLHNDTADDADKGAMTIGWCFFETAELKM